MSIEYKQFIDIPHIELAYTQKLKQAIKFNKKIKNNTDYNQVKQKAVDDIVNTTIDSKPSEIRRLRLLYKEVYSKAELEKLTIAILKEYGVVEF